ncbi:MAG: hypothetical protein H0Z34_08270 [Brevibacillus sp.]|nr:hypothetical protein [Brevibacillus sp.]
MSNRAPYSAERVSKLSPETSAGDFSPANGLANLPAKQRIRREIAAATASRRQRDVVLTLPLRIVMKRSWTASSLVGHRE